MSGQLRNLDTSHYQAWFSGLLRQDRRNLAP